MSLGLKPHTTRKPNRHTITQLIDAARKDTDYVSVFANGTDRTDSEEFIFIAKQPVAAHIERMLRSQRLITDKDVEGDATVDVWNPATCVGCGCTDRQACATPCSWLAVNRSPDDLTGVCSNCPHHLDAWRNARWQAAPAPKALVLPPMDEHLAEILGRVCFQCISIAQALRANGHTIATKAEAEQAAVIYWLLGFYATHGADWRKAAGDEIARMIEVATALAEAKAVADKGGPA